METTEGGSRIKNLFFVDCLYMLTSLKCNVSLISRRRWISQGQIYN